MRKENVCLLFHNNGLPTLRDLMGVFDSRIAAEKAVERYRDNCEHPPDLDQFLIIEKPVIGVAG
jgi:hypothetical protein